LRLKVGINYGQILGALYLTKRVAILSVF